VLTNSSRKAAVLLREERGLEFALVQQCASLLSKRGRLDPPLAPLHESGSSIIASKSGERVVRRNRTGRGSGGHHPQKRKVRLYDGFVEPVFFEEMFVLGMTVDGRWA
jgi:hypothetical protein